MTAKEFFKKYTYCVASPAFSEALAGREGEALEYTLSMFAFYIEQVETLAKKHTIEDVILAFYDNESKMPPVNAACKKGCAYCCNIQVSISKPEAEIIIDHCRANNIKIDFNYLEKQRYLNEQSHAKSDASKCVFLKDNVCSIYNVRPFSCRNYYVVSKPVNCDAVRFPHGRTVVLLDDEREAIRGAVMTYLNKRKIADQNSIARTLLSLK